MAKYIITITPQNNARALDGRKLLETVKRYNKNAGYASSIEEAVAQAKELAGENGGVMIFGSLSYLSDIQDVIL